MGRKFHLQTGVTGPANAWSPLHYVPLRLACGNPSIPGAVLYAAQTALLFFPLSSVFVGYNRRWLLTGALSGFTCSSTRRRFIHRANRALVFSAFFCLGAVPKVMSVALIELVEMTATLNVVVSINSTTVMQTY